MSEHVSESTNTGKYALPERAYEWVKQFAQIIFPAAITLYATLGLTWGWPAQEQVIATLGAINVFLGVVLKISTTSYNNSDKPYDGTIVVTPKGAPFTDVSTGEMKLNLQPTDIAVDLSGNELADKGEIRIKVKREDQPLE